MGTEKIHVSDRLRQTANAIQISVAVGLKTHDSGGVERGVGREGQFFRLRTYPSLLAFFITSETF